MARKVRVVPHDQMWAEKFRIEAEQIAEILGDEVVAVHHIGSTAIPNISAKPIVDLLVQVRNIATVDTFDPEMARRGYEPRGENGIPGRRYFVKGSDELRTHHVHVFQTGDPHIERHLDFRDYMRAHPKEAQAYGRLKERLARAFPEDIEGYMSGKDRFIKESEKKAGAWRARSSGTVSADSKTVPGLDKLAGG